MYKEINQQNLNDLVDLFIKAFSGEPWNEQWTSNMVIKRLYQIINIEGSYGIAYYYGNKAVGMVLGNIEYNYNSVDFCIKEFCIDPDFQGKGLGRKIMNEFILRVKEKNVENIGLLTCKSPETEGFYSKLKFKTNNKIIYMEKNVLM